MSWGPTAGGRRDAQLSLLVTSGIATALGLALTGQWAAILFSAGQTAALVSLVVRALRGRRGWRSAEFVVAASWFVLFTVPCWLYALRPGLLDAGGPARVVLIVNVALYAQLVGIMLWRPVGPVVGGPMASIAAEPRTRILIAWWTLGFAALAALLLRHGNPLNYFSRLDESQALNRGAFYLIALALLMHFSTLAWAAGRWSRGEPLERLALALAIVGSVLISVTGGRLFMAAVLVDFLLLHALLRRALPLRRVAPYAVVIGCLIVVGFGTIKRYQGYNASHPEARVGFTHYATEQAPSEFVAAYANNYVDTVRLLAIADVLVPRSADFEGGRALLELAVRPIPNSMRPEIDRQPVLRRAFNPSRDYSYAMPLIATGFLAGGILVLVFVSVAAGALVGRLDRALSSEVLAVGTVAVVVVAIVSIPGLLRAGVPAGAMLLLIQVVGMWVVARTGLRPAAPRRSGARGWRHEVRDARRNR